MEFANPAQRAGLYEALRAAETAGAVMLEMDREAPHLVSRVTLRDAEALYRHVGRRPAPEISDAAIRRVRAEVVATEEAAALKDFLLVAWSEGRTVAGLSTAHTAETIGALRAADAAFTPAETGPLPLRTRSARLLGDSKALERALPRLFAMLQQAGLLDPALTREEAVRALGLEKYAQPVLIAGSLTVGRTCVSQWPYIGIPPEVIPDVSARGVVSVLTIENLESFNRHVREARRSNEAVIYLGGFPAAGVVEAVRRIVKTSGVEDLYHWGDIDPGGVAIARYLETKVAASLRPHLMSPDIARRHGRPGDAAGMRVAVPAESALSPLAMYLQEPSARWLEQEWLDPAPVVNGSELDC